MFKGNESFTRPSHPFGGKELPILEFQRQSNLRFIQGTTPKVKKKGV